MSEIAQVLRQKALCLWRSPAPESTAGPQIGLEEGACWACVLRGHGIRGDSLSAVMWSGDDPALCHLSSGVLPAAQRSRWGEERLGPCILGGPPVGTGSLGCAGSPSRHLCWPRPVDQLRSVQPAHPFQQYKPSLAEGSSAPGVFSLIPGRPFRFLCVVTSLSYFHNSLCQLGLRPMHYVTRKIKRFC